MGTNNKCRILIVDDEDNLRNLLVKLIRKEGFEPIEAKDGKRAIELFQITNPELVISDVIMPEIDGITLLDELKKIDPEAIIILMTGFGTENILLKALRGGAANFFKKPFNFQEILEVIKNVVRHRSEKLTSACYSPFLIEESKYFEIITGKANLFPVINQLSLNMENVFPKSEIINLKIGIEEMLTNAIEHGNLGINFKEKNKAIENGNFGELLDSKVHEGNNRYKKVFVYSQLSKDKLQITIRDEGNGFDWRAIVNSFPNNFLTYNGRGIFLTKIFYDEVIFNEQGNEVTIIKKKKNMTNSKSAS